jgi:hypothetical protein
MYGEGWSLEKQSNVGAAPSPPPVQRIATPPALKRPFTWNSPDYNKGMDVGFKDPQANCDDPPASIQHPNDWSAGCAGAQREAQLEKVTPYR